MATKEYIKREWIILIVLLIPFLFAAVYWNSIPEKIPIHWNIFGQVDNEGQKSFALFLLPSMNIIFYFLFLALPHFDTRKENYQYFRKSYFILRLSVHLCVLLLYFITIAAAIDKKVNIGVHVMYLISALSIVIGALMKGVAPNYFVGVRTPWTLSNDDVWRRTHNYTSLLWVVASVLSLLAGIFLPYNSYMIIFVAYILIILIIPIFYSWYSYKKIQAN